jgi:hypothetical protein
LLQVLATPLPREISAPLVAACLMVSRTLQPPAPRRLPWRASMLLAGVWHWLAGFMPV